MYVNVILCSRNGEKYLRAQIESILKQTEQSVRLLISDDVSSDRTQEIEREYAEQYPERVRVRFRTVPSGGAARHFFLALQHFAEETGGGSLSPSGQSPSGQSPSGQYYMFADQDDVWHPDKVEKTLAAMREAEEAAASGDAEAAVSEDDEKAENSACTVPLLVHCDMRVVDEEEQEIAPSYVKYQQMSPERCRLNQPLVQNNVTGGAMMMNEALVRLILSRPLPRHAVMHDHWIALAAAAFGKVIFLDEALYDYRQHGSNVLGAAKGSRVREVLDRLGLFRKDGKTKKEMDRHSASVYEALFRQAAEFGRQYETPAGRREEKKDQGTPAGGKVSAAADGQVCHAANRQSCPAAETVLSPEQRKMILAFVSMRKMNRAQKTATILKYGFTFNRLHRTAGECLFM